MDGILNHAVVAELIPSKDEHVQAARSVSPRISTWYKSAVPIGDASWSGEMAKRAAEALIGGWK